MEGLSLSITDLIVLAPMTGGGPPPSPPSDVTWGDGTNTTWGDGTQVDWSANS